MEVAIGALAVALVLFLLLVAVRGFNAWHWIRSEVKPWLDRELGRTSEDDPRKS